MKMLFKCDSPLPADPDTKAVLRALDVNPRSLCGSRRRFLSSMATAAMELLFAGNRIGHAQSDMSAFFAVAYDDPGRQIAADFIGLSCESAILADDELNASNSSLLGLIRLLGRKGVIRIGGNTSERTVWRADANSTASSSFVITPASIDRLAACLRELGWKLRLGRRACRATARSAHSADASLLCRRTGGRAACHHCQLADFG